MNSNLLFEFIVDEKQKTIIIKREFNANLDLVWKGWTTALLLDQWCAPNPYKTETKTMDFKEGGFWLYSLIGPQGQKHWSRYDYIKIETHKSFTELRAFSDKDGTLDPSFPRTECTVDFRHTDSKTLVTITEKYGSPAMFDRMATDSHKKGFSSHLKNLDRLLLTLKK